MLSPRVEQGNREWCLQLVPNTSCLLLLHGHSLPLFHVGSLPWDAILPKLILRGLPTGSSSSRTAPTWLHTTGSIPQGQTAPARVPHEWVAAAPRLLLLRGLLSMGCSSSPGPAPAGALHGLQPPPDHIHLLHVGFSMGCSVEISMWDPGAAGGQPVPPGASRQAAGELLPWHLA